MYELIGYLGSIALACCGAPQAYKSYKDKNSDGISKGFLGLWTSGEVLTLIYIIPKADIPLLINYSLNLIFLSVIIYYKVRRSNA